MTTVTQPAAEAAAFLTEWHRIVRERDAAAIGALLAEDVTVLMRPINGLAALRDTIAPRMEAFLATLAEPSGDPRG